MRDGGYEGRCVCKVCVYNAHLEVGQEAQQTRGGVSPVGCLAPHQAKLVSVSVEGTARRECAKREVRGEEVCSRGGRWPERPEKHVPVGTIHLGLGSLLVESIADHSWDEALPATRRALLVATIFNFVLNHGISSGATQR